MNNEIVRCPRQRVTTSDTGDINMIVSEGIRRIMTASLTKCRVKNNDAADRRAKTNHKTYDYTK